MSDTPADFDHREQLARIDRALADAAKLREETNKFVAGQHKLLAEQQRFAGLKRGWDARLTPYLAIAAVIGGLLGLANFIAQLMGH